MKLPEIFEQGARLIVRKVLVCHRDVVLGQYLFGGSVDLQHLLRCKDHIHDVGWLTLLYDVAEGGANVACIELVARRAACFKDLLPSGCERRVKRTEFDR